MCHLQLGCLPCINALQDLLRQQHQILGKGGGGSGDPVGAPALFQRNPERFCAVDLFGDLVDEEALFLGFTHRREGVPDDQRVSMEPISDDFKRLTITYGFMETPNVPRALGLCRKQGLKFDIMSTSFFLGRRSVVASARQGMPLWQDKLFIFLMRNAANPTDFFHSPPGRVVELGTQVSV